MMELTVIVTTSPIECKLLVAKRTEVMRLVMAVVMSVVIVICYNRNLTVHNYTE